MKLKERLRPYIILTKKPKSNIKYEIKKVIRELQTKKAEAHYWFLQDLNIAKMSVDTFNNSENIAIEDANYQNGHEDGYQEAIDLLKVLLEEV